ncbi:MAG: RNB domain-containing ribonuclease [bacterium]
MKNTQKPTKGKNADKKKQEVLTGHISINSKGVGFFDIEKTDKTPEKSLEIQPENLSRAFHDDIVEVIALGNKIKDREQAKVVRVVSRAKSEFVGVVQKNGSVSFLIPDDKRMYVDIFLDPAGVKNIPDGVKVLVKIKDWKENEKNPMGEVVKVVGKVGDNNTEMESIVLEKGFRVEFPEAVLDEAEKLKKFTDVHFNNEIKNRRDMRDTLTMTIDPADAKDFDDAISFKDFGDGTYEIGVHIADVSHFVTPGTALDREAEKRGLSVYLVDRTIPMLPEILSNDLCSLNPHEDKYTFSTVFKMTSDGKILDKWFGKTVIHSDKRFSYEEANDVIHGTTKNAGESTSVLEASQAGSRDLRNLPAGKYSYSKSETLSPAFFTALTKLNQLAKILEKEKFQNGAINFESDEVKFELDKDGKPIRVYRKTRLDTHKLVEEYMLLANREVAKFIFHSQNEHAGPGSIKQSVYRIHGKPDRERIEDLATFLKALGFDLRNKDGEVTSRDINKLLKEVEGTPNEELIKTATIRSMQKAVYSTKNIGHFGLAFRFYTHFTSPIRRYPDLLVHRFLERELKGGKIEQNEYEKFERICMNASDTEKKAADAERASIKYKQVEYMQNHIGEIFDGTITGVTDWGIYVEDKETKCEGMVKLRDLSDDYYELDEKNYTLKGQRTGKKYTLGDTVKYKVVSADMEKRVLDYTFA